MTACGIRCAEAHLLHHDARDLAAFFGKALGRGQPFELHALFLGVLNLALRARHVRTVTAIETLYAFGTLADGRAHTVHRGVATADHDDLLAVGVQFAAVELGHAVAEIGRAVRCGQVIQRLDDPGRSGARAAQVAALIHARRDQDGIVLGADVFERDILTNVAIHDKGHAAGLKLFVAAHHHVLFQLETGDAIGQQPAGTVIPVIDGDLHTGAAQHVGGGQTTRPCADDPHAFGAFLRWFDRLDPTLFPGRVGDVFFDRSDRHRAMARLFDHAVAFAQAILRADTATNLGKGIRGLADLVRLLQAARGGQVQPVGDIVVQRAMRLAIRHAALAAAAGLLFRLFIRVLGIDLVKIGAPFIGATLFRHVTRNGYEFQHRLLGHDGSLRSDSFGRDRLNEFREE